jgi:hypothetical protein
MNYRANLYYEYVELLIPGVPTTGSTQANFAFEDQALIRTNPIYSICCYMPDLMPYGPKTGTPLLPLALMKTCFLLLNQNDPVTGVNKNGIDLMPLCELNYINDGTSPYVWQQPMFGGQTIIWDKSWVTQRNPGGLGTTTNYVIVFGVRFGYPQGIQGASQSS